MARSTTSSCGLRAVGIRRSPASSSRSRDGGKGLAELIRERYGIRWSAFATLSVLVASLGICISDFIGVGAALGLAGIRRR